MKKLLLLGSLISSAFADTTQVVQDDILKESTELLKCSPVTAEAIKPKLDEPTVLPVTTSAVTANPVEISFEDIEAPLKDLSPTEKLKAYRQKLEEKNLVLLEKKMEMIRLQQEMALLRTLERSMNQTLSSLEKL